MRQMGFWSDKKQVAWLSVASNTRVGIAYMVENHWPVIEAEYCIAEGGVVNRQGGKLLSRITSYNVCYTKLLRLGYPGRVGILPEITVMELRQGNVS